MTTNYELPRTTNVYESTWAEVRAAIYAIAVNCAGLLHEHNFAAAGVEFCEGWVDYCERTEPKVGPTLAQTYQRQAVIFRAFAEMFRSLLPTDAEVTP